MARDVEFDLTANDKTASVLAAAEAKFKATQERIDRESDKVGKSFEKMGDSGARTVARLRRELDLAHGNLTGLAHAFANAGSASERVDISKKMRAARAEITKLTKSLDLISPAFARIGVSGGQYLAGGLAAASPMIGGVISAAIIGGAGTAGVIGGVLLAARDSRVQSAGVALGDRLLSGLEQRAGSFVEPVLANISKIEARFDRMGGRIERIFDRSSAFLDPLVDGVTEAIGEILRGVDALVRRGGPVMEAFGDTFAILGDGIGDAMDIISGGSEDAAEALRDFARWASDLLRATAGLIRGLTELYGVIAYIPSKLRAASDWLGHLVGITAKTGRAADEAEAPVTDLGQGVTMLGTRAVEAGLKMTTFAERMDDAAAKGRTLFDAATNVGEAMARAAKAVKENGRTLSANTEKGRANRQALSSLGAALVANYQAYVKVNGEGLHSQAVAEKNRSAFIRLATQMGVSKRRAGELATEMGLIPAKKKTDFVANTHDAAARVDALDRKIDAIHSKTVTIRVQEQYQRARGAKTGGGFFANDGGAWAAADGSAGRSRTGGPTPVSVFNDVSVSLDGTPFRAMTIRAVRADREREAWRAKVGRR